MLVHQRVRSHFLLSIHYHQIFLHRAVFPSCVCFSFLQIQNNEGTGQLGRLHSLETIGVTVTSLRNS